MKKLNIDLETFSTFDLIKQGLHKYVEGVEIILFGYCFDWMADPISIDLIELRDKPRREHLPAGLFFALTDPTITKVAFNAPFEIACIEAYFDIKLDADQWECTQVRVAMAGLPFSLDQSSRVLNVAVQKDAGGKALIGYFCVNVEPTASNGFRTRNWPWHAPDKWEAFKKYNIIDIVAEMGTGKAVDFLPRLDTEKRLWKLDLKINTYGVRIDTEFVRNAISMDKTFRTQLIREAIEITGLQNPNSRNQLIKWLEEVEDIDVPDLKKASIPPLLKKVELSKSKRILNIRQQISKTSVKKYSTMLLCLGREDRIRGLLQFLGANRTGRWAARLVQLHNLTKSKMTDLVLDAMREAVLDNDVDIMRMLFESIPECLSQLVRTAFVPAPGKRFLVSDFSAIEARVISWLATEKWRLDIFAGHGKIYEATGARMFGIPTEQVTKGSKYRDVAKIAELACGFQGGVDAFIRMAEQQGVDLPEESFEPAVTDWRAANPNIVRLWKGTERAAVRAMVTGDKIFISEIIDTGYNGDGTAFVKVNRGVYFVYRRGYLFMGLPSGRLLCYYNARLEDGKYGKKITYMGLNQATKVWQKQDTYGGKLVENMTQAIARDCLANGLINLDDAGYDIAFHVHDEAICECADGFGSLEEMNQLMINPRPWMKDLPLKAEGFEGLYYKKEA